MSAPPEFSRPLPLDALGAGEIERTIEADAGECAALATRFGLEAIERLAARAIVRRDGPAVFAKGQVEASVVQACVVTGDPVPGEIAEPFDLRFVPEGQADGAEEEIELSAEECETLFYDGNAVDLGEAAAQTMALALDPFPRSGDAGDALREAGVISEEEAGPFGALKGLRDKLAGKD
ncbi:YceD family protein [Parasphingopyxis marina]|uniref:DUF177 domain-containing protein n=1 Tax=Parasphingopyxis marina TaxID=2761622 RepID=A0A842HR22_9SPHN|nr:DUF177 domain-containing protein [Parasphingopyxis marina]MBC2776218.1 DUF177 domain-containing protein [Parasphingopyxis marina]